MNARHRVIAICAAVALAGAGVSLAQEDNVLQRYDLALENLQFAIDSVPGDGVQARDELERAVNALLTLSRDATSVNLVQAMEQTFERARTAVENESRTDLAVQAAVLRGGFRRLVMDSALTADTAGQPEVARGRLLHLAADMGFTQAARDAVANAADGDAMRLAFEAGVADSIATELTVANRLLGTDRQSAYISLATAYGDSLMVQDSPRADVGLNQALLSSAQALVNGDAEAVAEATQTASAQLSRLAAAARAGETGSAQTAQQEAGPQQVDPQAATPQPATSQPEAGQPADPQQPGSAAADGAEAQAAEAQAGAPGVSPAVSPDDGAEEQPGVAGQPADAGSPAAAEEVAPGAVGDLPSIAGQERDAEAASAAPSEGDQLPGQSDAGLPLTAEGQGEPSQAAGADGASVSEIAALDDEQDLAMAAATLQQQERDAATAELSAELRAGGLSESQASSLASGLLDAGFSGPSEAVDALGATVSSAIASLRTGERGAAREKLADIADAYAGPLADLVAVRDPVVAEDTVSLLDSLQERPSLREHDLSLLAAQVDAVDRAIAGEPQAAGHAIELATDSLWSGWVRLIVLVVLGVLAFVPLRYLNLAFGGGNANWRLVAWALFLLLVPLVYEALAAIGSILAELLAMPSLDILASWSMFTSTTGQVVWAVLLLVALVLATIGLRGICRQFGLLGDSGRVGVGAAGANPTLVDMTRSTKPSAVDWDEEF